jgi:antitoxin FitA
MLSFNLILISKEHPMPSILIRDLPQATKDALKMRGVAHKRSMEEEARQILNAALKRYVLPPPELSFADKVRARFAGLGDIHLDIPPREAGRPLPTF